LVSSDTCPRPTAPHRRPALEQAATLGAELAPEAEHRAQLDAELGPETETETEAEPAAAGVLDMLATDISGWVPADEAAVGLGTTAAPHRRSPASYQNSR
jgi:hypothetical protein